MSPAKKPHHEVMKKPDLELNTMKMETNKATTVVVDFPNLWRCSQAYSDFLEDPSPTQRPYRTVRNPYFLQASKLMYLLPRTKFDIRNCDFHLVASVSPGASKDPSSYPIFQQYLKEEWRVHLSQRIETATGQKEAVDVHVATTAMRNFNNVDTLVLVSGDSDFLPLVEVFRESNKRVIVWAWRRSVAPSYVKSLEELGAQLYYLDSFTWLIGFIPDKEFNPDLYKPHELVCSSNRFTHYTVCDLVLSVAKERNISVDRSYCTILWNQGLKIAFRTVQQRDDFVNSTTCVKWCRDHGVNFVRRESENPRSCDDSSVFDPAGVELLFPDSVSETV